MDQDSFTLMLEFRNRTRNKNLHDKYKNIKKQELKTKIKVIISKQRNSKRVVSAVTGRRWAAPPCLATCSTQNIAVSRATELKSCDIEDIFFVFSEYLEWNGMKINHNQNYSPISNKKPILKSQMLTLFWSFYGLHNKYCLDGSGDNDYGAAVFDLAFILRLKFNKYPVCLSN